MKKEKLITLRLSNELYKKYIEIALAKSNKEQKIITVSEIIRETLTKNSK